MCDFCVLCAWEGCLCSMVWWKCAIFVYYVLEKVVCVVWFDEIECLLMYMCMRMMILWSVMTKMGEFCVLCAWEGCLCSLIWWSWVSFDDYVHENDDSVACDGEDKWILMPLCLRRANVWVVLVKMSDFWCMCAWEGCLCGLFSEVEWILCNWVHWFVICDGEN